MANISMNNIHWFPGHMKKALNQIKERIKLVDVIIEIVDARIPYSSLNPYLEEAISNKPRFLIMSKEDLADPIESVKWKTYFTNKGYKVVSLNLTKRDINKVVAAKIDEIALSKKEYYMKRGMKPQPIKTMIIGVPNVGKSTLINKLANRKAAGVENRPGFTRSQQWIKVKDNFYLLDTPGVLPMNYENQENAAKVGLTGAIREDILPKSLLVEILLDHFKAHYPDALKGRFNLEIINRSKEDILLDIAKLRGLKKGPDFDLEKAEVLLLKEFKDGTLGRFSLDIL